MTQHSLHARARTYGVAALVVIATSALLAGCGSAGDASARTVIGMGASQSPQESPKRAAAEFEGGSTCLSKTSREYQWTITNNLNVPLTMHSGPVNCEHWSGVSTPARHNDRVIQAGESVSLRLESTLGTGPFPDSMPWTESFSLPDGSKVISLRMTIADTCDQKCREMLVYNGSKYVREAKLPLAEIGGPNTGGFAVINTTSLTFVCKDETQCPAPK